MSIIEISWQKLLSSDSQIPPDVFFLVQGEGVGNDSKPIGAHRILLGGVSPVFMGMLFGPLKDPREVIEVSGTTHEAFNTMINYIYKPPGSCFFPAPRGPVLPPWHVEDFGDYGEDYEEDNEENDEKEDAFNQDKIGCPEKFFELLNLATMYQLESLRRELTSHALETLVITENNVIFAAEVAKNYRGIFEDVSRGIFEDISTRLLVKCLKFLLRKKKKGGDWTMFWDQVNNTEGSEEAVPLKARLAGTPFGNLTISHLTIKASLKKVGHSADYFFPGRTSPKFCSYYEKCLYLACSKVHVR